MSRCYVIFLAVLSSARRRVCVLWGKCREWCGEGMWVAWRSIERPRSVLFLCRQHHVPSARLQCTGAQGSSPRELVPRSPKLSPASPISRPLPPGDGSTSAAFRPWWQPDNSPV